MKDTDIRKNIVEWAKLFYNVEVVDVSSGSGVPKLSRLRIDGLRYALKISRETGRISFTRNNDGSWKLLSDVDRVLYIRVHPEKEHEAEVLVFSAECLLDRFEKTYQELVKSEQGHLPIWLSPNKEEGLRHIGSGFGGLAITTVTVPLNDLRSTLETDDHETDQTNSRSESGVDPIEEAKRLIANRFGISVERIEIEVKIS